MIKVKRKVAFQGEVHKRRDATKFKRDKLAQSGRTPRISKLVALASRMQSMIDSGQVGTYQQLAELGRISQPRMTQIMSLLNLAPNIQEELLYLGSATGIVDGGVAQEWAVATVNHSSPSPLDSSPIPLDLRSNRREVVWSPSKLRQAIFTTQSFVRALSPNEYEPYSEILVLDANGKEVLVFKEHTLPIRSVHFSPDGSWAISSSVTIRSESEAFLWETDTGKIQWSNKRLATSSGQVSPRSNPLFDSTPCAEFSPDGRWLALPEDGRIRIVAWSGFKDHFAVDSDQSVFFSPDSRRLVSIRPRFEAPPDTKLSTPESWEMKVWDVEAGREMDSHIIGNTDSMLTTRESNIRAIQPYVVFSPDSRFFMATVAETNAITIYDLSTGAELNRLELNQENDRGGRSGFGSSRRVVFSPDGSRLMILDGSSMGSRPQSTTVWELPSCMLSYRLEGHAYPIKCTAFSADGKRIATVANLAEKGEVKVWDAATGREMITLTSQEGFIGTPSISFSSDGHRLILQHKMFSRAEPPGRDSEIIWDATPRTDSPQPVHQ